MPLYQYKCEKCDHEFEKMGKYGDKPPVCPKCEGDSKRVPARTTFKLKGGGWASDGYSK